MGIIGNPTQPNKLKLWQLNISLHMSYCYLFSMLTIQQKKKTLFYILGSLLFSHLSWDLVRSYSTFSANCAASYVSFCGLFTMQHSFLWYSIWKISILRFLCHICAFMMLFYFHETRYVVRT